MRTHLSTMNNPSEAPSSSSSSAFDSIRQIVRAQRRMFTYLLIAGLALGIGRYILPFPGVTAGAWVQFAVSLVMFVIGVLIAPFTFLMESRWKPFLVNRFSLQLPGQSSPLRTGILFVVLPILGVFVITSSRAPIGLGFLWGISLWYAMEAWWMLQGNQTLWQAYFRTQEMGDSQTTTLLWGFCLYAVLLSLGILVI